MRRLARWGSVALLALLVLYVGSFVAMVERGRKYAERDGLRQAYFLADPYSEGGIERHYRRGCFFAPLVEFARRTGGLYFVFPDTFRTAAPP